MPIHLVLPLPLRKTNNFDAQARVDLSGTIPIRPKDRKDPPKGP